ncbi:MAG: glucose 1-dehydrogenase [Dongiaceae bacterium]
MGRFTDKVAVVTGASKGIGAGIAKRLAAEGASVVVNYASSERDAERVVDEIRRAGGKAVAIGGSVAKEAEAERLLERAGAELGRVDVLVNNAGVYAFAPIERVSAESFTRQFETNVLGLLLATRAAAKLFPASGGSIVNIGSVVTALAPPEASVYAGTKAAVETITKSLAKELAPRRIRVNGVSPGFVVTEGTKSAGLAGGDFETNVLAITPLGRAGRPEDIAAAVAFLASEEASWITGESLVVSGGAGM